MRKIFNMPKITSLLAIFLLIVIINISKWPQVEAQKGGVGFSKFKKTIESFRQSQQQVIPTPVQSSSSSFSSSSIQQQNIPIASSELVISSNNQQIEEQQQQQQRIQAQHEQYSSSQVAIQDQLDHDQHLYGSVAGIPGQDFPAYERVPLTKFNCDQVPITPGLYADLETGCQAFHVCFDGRRESFLCGIGTVFNQQTLNCDYWYSVECANSPQYYSANIEFGKSGNWQNIEQNIRQQNFVSSSLSSTKGGSTSSQQATSFLQAIRPVQQQASFKKQQTNVVTQLVVQQPAPITTTSIVRNNNFVESSIPILGGKTSLPKHQKQSSFFQSFKANSNQLVAPVVSIGAVKGRSSSISQSSSAIADSSDNNLLESNIMRVRMKMNNTTNMQPDQEEPKIPLQNYSNQIMASQDNEQWRPISRNSKVNFKQQISENSISTPIKLGQQQQQPTTTTSPASPLDGDTGISSDTRNKEALEIPKFGSASSDETSSPAAISTTTPESISTSISDSSASTNSSVQTTTEAPIVNPMDSMDTERVNQANSISPIPTTTTISAENKPDSSESQTTKSTSTESTEQPSITMKLSSFDSNRTDNSISTTTTMITTPESASSSSSATTDNGSVSEADDTTTTVSPTFSSERSKRRIARN